MPTTALHHVNIRTDDMEATVTFYADVLELDPRPVPFNIPPDQARWLHDAAGRPIIHVSGRAPVSGSTGPIDHVALACTGRAALIARLERRGVAYELNQVSPDLAIVFARDPHGIMLELRIEGE